MTTTYDTDSTESVSTAYYDTDPNTHTVAAAWASSPLGEPDGEVRYGFAATGAGEPDVAVHEPTPLATRAMLVAALVSGIVGGATLGAVLFGYADPAQPTVVVPGSGAAQTVPSNAVVATPSSPPAPPKPDAVPAPAPKTVVSAPKSAQAAAPAPKPAADPGTPPVSPRPQYGRSRAPSRPR